MDTKELEEIIICINVSLKKWKQNNKLAAYSDVRCIILNWLNKFYLRQTHTDRRTRKQLSSGFKDSLFYLLSEGDDPYIKCLNVRSKYTNDDIQFPLLDYEKLNTIANERLGTSLLVLQLEEVNFNEINKITF